jgi:hypothetical protein
MHFSNSLCSRSPRFSCPRLPIQRLGSYQSCLETLCFSCNVTRCLSNRKTCLFRGWKGEYNENDTLKWISWICVNHFLVTRNVISFYSSGVKIFSFAVGLYDYSSVFRKTNSAQLETLWGGRYTSARLHSVRIMQYIYHKFREERSELNCNHFSRRS